MGKAPAREEGELLRRFGSHPFNFAQGKPLAKPPGGNPTTGYERAAFLRQAQDESSPQSA